MCITIYVANLFFYFSGASHEYSSSCLPGYRISSPQDNRCILYLQNGPETETNVTIYTISESYNITLEPDELYQEEVGEELWPSLGAGSFAIRIVATAEIQVLMYNLNGFNDVVGSTYQIRSLDQSGTQFYTASFEAITGFTCPPGDSMMHYFLVMSFDDDTSIQVTLPGEETYEVDLPEFGVYFYYTRDQFVYLNGTSIEHSNQ